MYILFHKIRKEPYCGELYPTPQMWDKHEDAEICRLNLPEDYRDRFEVRRHADPKWRSREYARFQNGTYQHVSWHLESFWQYVEASDAYYAESGMDFIRGPIDHYAHVSIKDLDKVAYTPDSTKGELDIQVVTTPGRYLTKFYPELGSKRIRELADKHREQFCDLGELEFANTSDAIEEVYLNGPASCMSKPGSAYSSGVHPIRVYADGDTPLDLAVAYVRSGDRITARTICWPEKKRYVLIYGDAVKLSILLARAGYEKDTNLDGARLAIVPWGSVHVMPYLDCAGGVVRDGAYWRITSTCYKYSCGETGGLLDGADDDESYEVCDNCEDHCEEGSVIQVQGRRGDHEFWCEGCVENNTFTCAYNGNTYATRWHDMVYLHNGDIWHSDTFDEHGFTCERTSEHYSTEDRVTVLVADEDNEGETLVQEWSRDAAKRYPILEIITSQADLERAGQQRLELEVAA